jgi:hypothetical protein
MLRFLAPLACLIFAPVPVRAQSVVPTVDLVSFPNPSHFNEPVSLSVGVTAPFHVCGGTVTIREGPQTVATVALSRGPIDAGGRIIMVGGVWISSLSVGSHTLLAEYPGDVNFGCDPTTSAPLVHEVLPPDPIPLTSPMGYLALAMVVALTGFVHLHRR